MLEAKYSSQLRKDVKRIIKRGLNSNALESILTKIEDEIKLDDKYRDHALKGNYAGCRECHIESDWLLVDRISNRIVYFERTGTHSDLFR